MKRRRVRWGRVFFVLLLLALIPLGGRWAWDRFMDPRILIALDAGHGGSDPGASGLVEETFLTETTVSALAELLENDPSYRVLLCRELDEGADVNSRWEKANSHRAGLLLSIHGNSSEDPTAAGFEVYPSPPGRQYHEESFRFASLVAEHMAGTGIRLRGEDGIRYAYYVDGQKTLVDPSANLPDAPSFAMVDYPECPAALAEQCFITNDGDVALLGTEEGCRTAARNYYLAICDYFGTEPVEAAG